MEAAAGFSSLSPSSLLGLAKNAGHDDEKAISSTMLVLAGVVVDELLGYCEFFQWSFNSFFTGFGATNTAHALR